MKSLHVTEQKAECRRQHEEFLGNEKGAAEEEELGKGTWESLRLRQHQPIHDFAKSSRSLM